jgi:hypothetical protein
MILQVTRGHTQCLNLSYHPSVVIVVIGISKPPRHLTPVPAFVEYLLHGVSAYEIEFAGYVSSCAWFVLPEVFRTEVLLVNLSSHGCGWHSSGTATLEGQFRPRLACTHQFCYVEVCRYPFPFEVLSAEL